MKLESTFVYLFSGALYKKCAVPLFTVWHYTISAHIEKCKQLLEYQNLLLLSDIWWLNFKHIFWLLFILLTPVFIRHLWQLKTAIFLHRCLNMFCPISAPAWRMGSHCWRTRTHCRAMEVTHLWRGQSILENVSVIDFFSGWKPTNLTYVFSLRTSVLSPDGTMLTALIQMLIRRFADVRLVGFLPPLIFMQN
jgi:hypothetical protein